MTYNYEHTDGRFLYKILDGKKVRSFGSYPDTVEGIESILQVLVNDEEVLKEREGEPR